MEVTIDEKERYSKYLCSAEWWSRRNAVMLRCDNMCEECFIQEALHVHHLTYVRKYNESLTDLKALCKECHDAIHKAKFTPKKTQKETDADEATRREWLLGRAERIGRRDQLEQLYAQADNCKSDDRKHWFALGKIKYFLDNTLV